MRLNSNSAIGVIRDERPIRKRVKPIYLGDIFKCHSLIRNNKVIDAPTKLGIRYLTYDAIKSGSNNDVMTPDEITNNFITPRKIKVMTNLYMGRSKFSEK